MSTVEIISDSAGVDDRNAGAGAIRKEDGLCGTCFPLDSADDGAAIAAAVEEQRIRRFRLRLSAQSPTRSLRRKL